MRLPTTQRIVLSSLNYLVEQKKVNIYDFVIIQNHLNFQDRFAYIIKYIKTNSMKVITLSELRKNMKRHFDEVTDSMETIAISRNNKEEEAVIIMSLKEYNSLKETNYLLSTQTNRYRLNKSIQEMNEGKTIKFDI